MTEPTVKDVAKSLAVHGKRAALTMSVLGGLQPFIQAINSPVGKELLEDDINRHEELLTKIYNENATPQEMAEFRYLKSRLTKVSKKVNQYIEGVNEIKSK